MKQVMVVDICNTLANVNEQLERLGFDIRQYPAAVPGEVFHKGDVFLKANPINETIFMLRMMAIRYEVVYLTARSFSSREITLQWLEKHDCPSGRVHHTLGYKKGDFFRHFMKSGMKVEAVFEDSPQEIESIRTVAPDVKIYIPRWHYNEHVKGYSIPTSFPQAKQMGVKTLITI